MSSAHLLGLLSRVYPRPAILVHSPRGLLGHRIYSHISRHLPPLPPGKVPRFPAILVHFPPWLAGAPALQPSLAAPAVSTPGESAANFHDFGALSPVACWGIGSTAISRGTCRLFPRGKCRGFPRFWCTFPRGLLGHRLYSHLSWHLPPLPPGKVPGIPAILVHFPPWHETSGEVQQGRLVEVLIIKPAFLGNGSSSLSVSFLLI